MTLLLGCIADDYTGASDLANTLTRNGLRVLQVLGVPDSDLNATALAGVEAVVVALKTRSVAPEQAVSQAMSANAWLREHGAPHILLKICSTFDSTKEGNIGPVTDALRQSCGADVVPVCPAFPGTGRTVYSGYLFVQGVLLSESPLRDHPLNPMRDANLVRVLRAQSRGPVGLADFSAVDQGPDVLRGRLKACARKGEWTAIVDAVNERHLETLGKIAAEGPLSVGASGLGLGLARALRRGPPASAALGLAADLVGPCAMIAGSCSAATLEQVDRARQRFPFFQLDVGLATADPAAAAAAALDWAEPYLGAGCDVLIASSASAGDRHETGLARADLDAARMIEQALADIAYGLHALGVQRFVVAGGETSGAVVERLGLKALRIGREVAPGVPVVYAADASLALVLKSGNFGGSDFFADAVGAIMEQASA